MIRMRRVSARLLALQVPQAEYSVFAGRRQVLYGVARG